MGNVESGTSPTNTELLPVAVDVESGSIPTNTSESGTSESGVVNLLMENVESRSSPIKTAELLMESVEPGSTPTNIEFPPIAVDVESGTIPTNTSESGVVKLLMENVESGSIPTNTSEPGSTPTNTAELDGQANQEGYQDLALLGVNLAAAGATVQALQTKGPLPIISQLVCVALVLSLIAILCTVHKFVSKVFHRIGIFLGVTGFVAALVCNLHPLLMGATVGIYIFAIVAIILGLV